MNYSLKNKTILITHTIEPESAEKQYVNNLKINIISFPTIKISLVTETSDFYKSIASIADYNFIVFTSMNAVSSFVKLIHSKNIKVNFNKTSVICVGTKTASACRQYGIPVNLVPNKFSASGVAQIFSETDLTNQKFFIPSSKIARNELKLKLEAKGALVNMIPIYTVKSIPKNELTVSPEYIKTNVPDVFAFTSPSSYNNFIKILKIGNALKFFNNSTVAAIGPTTAKAITDSKVNIDIIPGEFTVLGLLKAVNEYFISKNKMERGE